MIGTFRLSFVAVLLAVFGLIPAARGQFSAYADVTVEQQSGIRSSPLLNILSPAPCAGNVAGSNCTTYNNSVHPIGFTGGGTYDFKTLGPALLGIDLRAIIESDKRGAQANAVGSGVRTYSGLGGLRASFGTPFKPLRPYVQGSAGFARSNYGLLTNAMVSLNTINPGVPTQNALEYHVFVGADLKIVPALDWRVFEVGFGGLESFGTYAHTYPLYSVSSGIVFHIPPRP